MFCQCPIHRHYYHGHHNRILLCVSATFQCARTLCISNKKWLLCPPRCFDLSEQQSICLDYFGVSNCCWWWKLLFDNMTIHNLTYVPRLHRRWSEKQGSSGLIFKADGIHLTGWLLYWVKESIPDKTDEFVQT